MTAFILVVVCISGAERTCGLQHPKSPVLHKEEFAKATGGLWRIEKSKSFVQVDGTWRENSPPWRYVLFIDDLIVTFRKSGEPHYWATTTQVRSAKQSGRTTSFEAEDSSGVKRSATMRANKESELMELTWEWRDVVGIGHHPPFAHKSERTLRKVRSDKQLELLVELMKGCKFLSDDGSKHRNIVERFIDGQESLENKRLNPNDGSGEN